MNKTKLKARLRHGTKYPKVDELPTGAMLLTEYAARNGYKQGAYISVKYDRFVEGKTPNDPGYIIVNWQGFNFVVPH